MTQEQAALMLQIQQLGLTKDDLGEYLDTHPTDAFAIERFNMTVEQYQQLSQEYSNAYNPLVRLLGNKSAAEWQWATTDFPWDY